MRDEYKYACGYVKPRPKPVTPPDDKIKLNRCDLDRVLALELVVRGQVKDTAAGLKITCVMSKNMLVAWLRDLGYSIG